MTLLSGAATPGVKANVIILSRGLFISRHRSLGLRRTVEVVTELSSPSASTLFIPGPTILGSPRAIRFSLKLFDRPNRR
jgi:hypothetical protein